ncbi:hypothetical protein BJ912DRAFT_935309 [Pholiota molesta]|nr:hypothetical protein BJ912DRAFT_935309 [Pholiota molesta]
MYDISSYRCFDAANWEHERRSYEAREHDYQEQIRSLKEQVARLQRELDQQTSRATTGSPPLILRSPFGGAKTPAAPAPSPVTPSPSLVSLAPLFSPSGHSFLASASAAFAPAPTAFTSPPLFSAPTNGKTPATPLRKRTEIKSPKTTRAKVAVDGGLTPSGKSTTAAIPVSLQQQLVASASASPRRPLPIVGAASRAALMAQSLGYDAGKIAALHLIARYVQSPFWSDELVKAGFDRDDLKDILDAMIVDMS